MGIRHPHLQPIIVDGVHVFVKIPDRLDVVHPGAMVRWNDKKFAQRMERKFTKALQKLGISRG